MYSTLREVLAKKWLVKTAFLLTLALVLLEATLKADNAQNTKKPKVSIITSMFIRPGDTYLKSFLKNIVQLKNFDECELILIDANSPQDEEPLIQEYVARYSNIVYEKLTHDPGIYGVWNHAIKKASAEFITNANLDDLRNPEALNVLVKALEDDPSVDLVYGNYYLTYNREEEFSHTNYQYIVEAGKFEPSIMYLCIAGPQPVWRKSLHDTYGFFRSDMISSGDLEMWNRAVSKGALLKHVNVVTGLFYNNPEGLSTTKHEIRSQKREQESRFIRGAYSRLWNGVSDTSPRLVIKMPTRWRPEKFFAQLHELYGQLSGEINYHFLITCDRDDMTMNNPQVIERLNAYPYLSYSFGDSSCKVEAYNADLDKYTEWDILLAVGDDMEPVVKNYDKIIVDTMLEKFPQLDGVLNFHDGFVGAACNTYPVVGREFIKKFTNNTLYNPEYKSLFANEELTLVSRSLGKEYTSSTVLIRHNHPVYQQAEWDNLYIRNEGLKERDRLIFNKRKAQNFNLDVVRTSSKLWSILICTLEERSEQFSKLYKELIKQITNARLQDTIEILFIKDNREQSIGSKRNALVTKSKSTYISFIDDDDWISEDYITTIYQKLLDKPDCIMLRGIITTKGQDPHLFIHSTRYNNNYTYHEGMYYRPPNHLSPLLRSIAIQFPFVETNFGEDKDWSLRIAESGLLRKEAAVEKPYYFYRYDGKYE